MIKQIGLPLRGRPILLITRMITDRIGLHSVRLPLLIIIIIALVSSDKKHFVKVMNGSLTVHFKGGRLNLVL